MIEYAVSFFIVAAGVSLLIYVWKATQVVVIEFDDEDDD
jgi:hypothetical protein